MIISWKIADVNEGGMTVVFSSDGLPDVTVGTRLPYTDETVESLVVSYAPVGYWATVNKTSITPSVGISGQFDTDPPAQASFLVKQPITSGTETL